MPEDSGYNTNSHTLYRPHKRYESFAYRVRRLWILHLAVTIHLIWGFLILFTGDLTTSITAISDTRHLLGSALAVAIAYLVAGMLSWLAMQLSDRVPRLIVLGLLLPQQFLLMISAMSGILAILASSFADGIIRPRVFLIADQGVAILVAVFHTAALWDVFTEGVFKKTWIKFQSSRFARRSSRL